MPPASSDEIGASSDEITLSSDETGASSEYDYDDISLPSSPSASPEPDDPSSLLDELDTATSTLFKKKKWLFPRGRTWPAADDLALIRAAAAHHEQHGRLPSGGDLSAALRGSGIQASAELLAKRLRVLGKRYRNSLLRLARGTVPEMDADVEIFRVSKRIWGCPWKKPRPAPVQHHERRGFGELEGMYPCLAAEVEAVEARRPRGAAAGALKRAFGRIGDDAAAALEKKARKQRLAELKANAQRAELRKETFKTLLEFIE